MDQPHIVPVYDTGRVEGSGYFISNKLINRIRLLNQSNTGFLGQIIIFFKFVCYLGYFADNNLLNMHESNQIIEQVLSGDTDKFRDIVIKYESDVYRIVAPVIGGRSAAEDVTQEVFLTAYRRLESFDLSEPFRPWLLGIAINIVRNELRRFSRETARMELYSHYLDVCSKPSDFQHASNMSEALAKCREQLAQTASEAIKGRYNEGLSLEELAERLERSVTATRQLLYRARLALKDCIESQLSCGGGNA